MPFTPPLITEIPGGIEFAYMEEEHWPVIQLRDFNRSKSGDLTAELDGFCMDSEAMTSVKGIKFNINSLMMRKRIAEGLKSENEINWNQILADVSWRAIKFYRNGDAPVEIWPSVDDDLKPTYLLEPLLYLNHPTVLFGDYGSLKSLVALSITYLVQLPYYNNPLGLITLKESTPCLYLDYEDDPSSFKKRWSALESGFNQGAMPVLYRRMTATISDSAEQLRNIISDKKTKLVIVDSLGPAARGNLNDPEPAIKYHAALRQLGITSLTLAHTAKDSLTKKRSIFGSVFFTNLARSVWECKAEQETGEDEAIISLKHNKANLSKLHSPLGYHFAFTENSIKITKTDLALTSLSGELPLSWQIKNVLKRGPFSVKEIAEELEKEEDTIGRSLRRMKTKKQVVKLENNSWGLSA